MSSRVSVPQIDIDAIVMCFKNAVARASNEEELRIGVSRCTEDMLLKPLGIKEVGRYEYLLVSGARVDALYGHVIVEFKAPGKLSKQSDIQKAKEQVIRYITQEAGGKQEWSRYLGIIISDRIAFVRYDPRTDTWILRGPYDIKREIIIKLVEAVRGLRRKPLDADHLVKDFGPQSTTSRKIVSILYKKLISTKNERTRILFEDWMRLFKQATGYKPEELKDLPELAKDYGMADDVNYDALIFAIHTYYALLLKLIAAEVAYLYGAGKFYKSYIAELDDAYARSGVEGLKEVLKDLESGGIFKRLLRIENFLEGDYFSWYLQELDKELGDTIAELVRALSDYELATPQLEPEFARDLLKRLYQHLVPRDIRHNLGEYYTPDWLANLILDEVGLSLENLEKLGQENPLKPLEIRVLDPACGSGTFLVLYISRLRRYAEEHFLQDVLINYILNNIVGYDLNPLAVLTARTNYLLAVADLLQYATGSIEIPVYLADSILVERRAGIFGASYVLKTVAGEFEIPITVVDKGLLQSILSEVKTCLDNKCSSNEFRKRIESIYKLDPREINTLAKFYEKMFKLEQEGKNDVWLSILRNAFAPILKGKFDYVVGNPPWVNWENLPEEYIEVSKDLWEYYGLAEMKGKVGLGKVKRDLAMLFLVRSLDLYLKEGGKLGFLMPFTAFKVQAGAGFRSFLAKKTKIHVVHDLVTLYPFGRSKKGAVNRTSAIVVEKICEVDPNKIPDKAKDVCMKALEKAYEENMNGVKHIIWDNPTRNPIPLDKPLEEVLRETKRYEAIMLPLKPGDPGSPWMQIIPKAVNVVRKLLTGTQYYKAYEGVNVALNQVYHIRIKGKTPDGKLIITNPPEPRNKKKVKQVEAIIEPDLVYPLIIGDDINRWHVEFKERYIILPVDLQGNSIKPQDMKIKYPNTYNYFSNYFNELVNRGGEPYKSKLRPYREKPLEYAEKIAPPFYWVFNAKPSLAPYKVAWKYVSGEIKGKGEFSCTVIGIIEDKFLGNKIAIPNEKVMIVPLYSEDEAYYLCGILNSTIVRAIVASYTIETEISTHILENIRPPKFNPANELHRKIAELSRRAHELAKCIYAEKKPDYCRGIDAEQELKNVEREIDLAVAQLFGLSEDDVREFKKLMAILSGEELLEEEVVEVPKEPSVTVLNTLIPPNTESYIEVEVVNPSGEEISIVYEFPWGKGSFSIVEGRQRIRVPPLSPGKYSGVVKYVWCGVEKVINVVVEVSDVGGPKRQRRLVS